MKLIRVRLRNRGYDIVIGKNIIGTIGRFLKNCDYSDNAVIVTNPTIKKIYGKKISGLFKDRGINAIFLEIADTEKSKSAKTCLELVNRIAAFAIAKRIFIIALGGGVVGDLAGFIASIYKRGVPYMQLPTTLVAQVDSAIGGKVAIDLKAGKNLVGAFYQPRLVFSELTFLDTLPKREIINGLSEVIKYAVIKDARLFEFLENNLEGILRLNEDSIEHIISTASQIKARIVEQDEFDNLGIRAILNYGHTIGHAVETASGYSKRYAHGEAISVGMIAANFISNKLGFISDPMSSRIKQLLQKTGLPVKAEGVNPQKIYNAYLYDKKFTNGKNRFVLAYDIGHVKLIGAVSEKLVKKAIDLICCH